MKLLLSKLYKNNKNQTIIFIGVSILNLVIVGVFSKLMIEIDRIKEETERISRDGDLMMYFTMLIVVSVMIILFSLWIIQIVSQTIFNSRKEFNIQLRLSGITRKKLSALYIRESLQYQLIVIPIGVVLMEAVYYGMSRVLDISSHWIGPANLLIAVGLHLGAVILCLMLTLNRITRFDPLEEMRSPYKAEKIRVLTKMDVITGIAGGVLILSALLPDTGTPLVSFLPLVGAFLIFDLVLVSLQYLLRNFAMKFKIRALNLGQRNLLGYYKKISPIFSTLIVGVMVSMGLMGMFETMRGIARDTVEQNIYFQHLIVHSDVKEYWSQAEYEELVQETDPQARIAYGINMEMTDEDDIKNTIYAIDEDYLIHGEKMQLTDGTDPSPKLNDPDFNGIYLPDYFISDKEIGQPYRLRINSNEVEFVIAGRFIANGSRGRYGFVSKSYLQSLIGNDMVNALYIEEAGPELIDLLSNHDNVISCYSVSKADIANNSYDNAINGVEIFELSAFMVILISVLMLVHFYLTAAGANVFDITRLRAMGVGIGVLKKAYIFQAISIVTQSFLFGALLAYSFIKIGVSMSLDFIDVPVRLVFPVAVLLAVYIMTAAIGSVVVYLSVRKGFGSDLVKYLTVSE